MVWNWILKKIVSPERIIYLIKNNQEVITENMKDIIQDVLEDQETTSMIIQYIDNIYNRYLGKSGKFWSTIGGYQRNLDYTMEKEIQQVNPLSGFIDDKGEISLSGIVKGILSQAVRGNISQQQQEFPPQTSRGTPLMKPI